MNRRNFLGSIIGLVASQPFLAKLLTDPVQKIHELVIQPDYKIGYLDNISGLIIQAPGIKEIVQTETGWQFIAYPLEIKEKLTLAAAHLFDKDNNLIRASKLSFPATCTPGDTFNATYSLNFDSRIVRDSFKDTWSEWENRCNKIGANPSTTFEIHE